MQSPAKSPAKSPTKRTPNYDLIGSTDMQKGNTELADVDMLFRIHNVEEIKNVEKKLRGDIEKKKEDLRLMAGERYRDLINAADTIKEMRNLTHEVSGGISSMENCCDKFKKRNIRRKHKRSGDLKSSDSQEAQFYALATQMELLVDTPEKIWSALDMHQYLMAAQLYLMGHHIVNNTLPIGKGQTGQTDVFVSFPILHHQWAAISHFKASILKGSRVALKDATLPDKALAESLCSIVLLDDSSPRQVFMEFLLARKAAIQDIFHPSHHSTSVKRQFCDITGLLILTVQQISALFYCKETKVSFEKLDDIPLLYDTINKVTSRRTSDQGQSLQLLFGEDFDVLTVARHLPATVLDFRPKLRSGIITIPTQNIQNNSREWLARCIEDVQNGVSKILSYVKSVKGLANIRNAVYDVMKNLFTIPHPDENMSHDMNNVSNLDGSHCYNLSKDWSVMCNCVFGKSLSIWDEFYESLFLSRAKAILHDEFVQTQNNIINHINNNLDGLDIQHRHEEVQLDNDIGSSLDTELRWERDITSYMWHEFPGDLPSYGWAMEVVGSETRLSTLTLKAKGCTPAVERLCENFDSQLKKIATDARYLIFDCEKEETKNAIKQHGGKKSMSFSEIKSEEKEPFQKYSCALKLQEFLQLTASKTVDCICNHCNKCLEEFKSNLQSNGKDRSPEGTSLYVDRVAFLSRICLAMPEHCYHLQELLVGKLSDDQKFFQNKDRKLGPRKYKQTKGQSTFPQLDELNKKFQTQYNAAFVTWKNWICDIFKCTLEKSINSEEELMVFGTTSWEDVLIEEEGETGQKVKSKIKVPSQVSSFLLSLLFRLSEEIHRFGGHTLDTSLIQELTLDIGYKLMECIEKHVHAQMSNKGISQNRALQFIFDLKFTILLLGGNIETKEQSLMTFRKRGSSVVEQLEQFIDPFDLDVFAPHVTSFINRQLQRSWLLLGTLSSMDKHSLPVVSQRSTNMAQEQHSVIPLSPNPVRFMLLPISSQHDKSTTTFISDFADSESQPSKLFATTLSSPIFTHMEQYSIKSWQY